MEYWSTEVLEIPDTPVLQHSNTLLQYDTIYGRNQVAHAQDPTL